MSSKPQNWFKKLPKTKNFGTNLYCILQISPFGRHHHHHHRGRRLLKRNDANFEIFERSLSCSSLFFSLSFVVKSEEQVSSGKNSISLLNDLVEVKYTCRHFASTVT